MTTWCSTDPRRLERIVGNLVENALEHGGARVSVAIALDDGERRSPSPTGGPGIDSEHLPYVFDRFYKADRARAEAGPAWAWPSPATRPPLGGDTPSRAHPGPAPLSR